MLNSLIVLLPLCSFAVATDAPNPRAIYQHEMAHCWGWKHFAHEPHGTMTKSYRAPSPSAYWQGKGAYPKDRLTIYYDTGRNIARNYCNGNAYGCQWYD